MTSLPRIKSSNSLNKSVSKDNLFELHKSSSKESVLESVLESMNGVEDNVTFISEQKIFEETEWQPPTRSGLRNSEPIIPSYYLQKMEGLIDENGFPVKYMNVDYITIIKDDIRNFRKLNEYQIRYIKTHLNNTIKNEIIDELIRVSNASIDIINKYEFS